MCLDLVGAAEIDDYPTLQLRLDALRAGRVRLAVDDAGAGYASFRHIVQLAPDIIKADVALTRGINVYPARQALVRTLARFARDTGAAMITEGVETAEELAVIRRLRVPFAQGYLLGRPQPAAVYHHVGS